MSLITDFLKASSIAVYSIIFLGKLTEVALSSLRSQLIHKGQRWPGAVIAIFEYLFWLTLTATALTGFANDPYKIVILVLAFSAGQVVGSILEEKLAFGYNTVTAIFKDELKAYVAADKIRETNQALTILYAEGIGHQKRTALLMAVKRKNIEHIKSMLNQSDPDVMITVSTTQYVSGAFISL